MKRMENLQEELKNLPKHTLNDQQKEKIILSLKAEKKSENRIQIVKPFIAFALLFATVFILFVSSDSDKNSWMNELKKSFQPQIELHGPEAEVFKLPDSQQELFGITGKLGVLGGNEKFVAEDSRRGAKLMLYFWGNSSELINKNYRVEALNKYNTKIILAEGILSSPIYSEDAHTLTSFLPFPTEGKWQLSFFVEDQLFEEFTIEVLPPFPKTEHYTLINHPKELKVGEEIEMIIESFIESEKEIEVKLLNKKGRIMSEHIFIQDGIFKPVSGGFSYHYLGNINFPERGIWTVIIDGEKSKPFKN